MKKVHRMNQYGLCLILFLSIFSELAAEPYPLELVNSQRRLSRDSRPVVSPDGRWLAFAVSEPRAHRVVSLENGVQYQKNWMPLGTSEDRLYLLDLHTRKSFQAGPPKSGALRPSWSPSGEQLAFYAERGDGVGLYVSRAPNWEGRFVSEVRIHPRRWVGDEPRWLDESQILVGAAIPENTLWLASLSEAGEADEGPALYGYEAETRDESLWQKVDAVEPILVNLSNGTVASLMKGPTVAKEAPTVMFVSPSGKFWAYVTVSTPTTSGESSTLVVERLDGSGESIRVKGLDLFYDSEPVVQWHPVLDRLFLKVDRSLKEVDLDTGSLSQIGPTPLDYPFHFARDGKSIFSLKGISKVAPQWYSQVREPKDLIEIPLDGGSFVKKSTPHSPDEIVSLQGNSLLYRAGSALYQYDQSTEEVKTALEWEGKLSSLIPVSHSDAVIANLDAFTTPPDLFWIQPGGGKERLTEFAPALNKLPPVTIERFTTYLEREAERIEIRTAVILPEDYEEENPPPAVLKLYPGALGSQDAASFSGSSTIPNQVFTSRGYAVIECDLPLGPSHVPGEFLADLVEVTELQVKEATERRLVDPKRVAVVGHSHGGYAAASVSAGSDLFACGVAMMGVYDLSTAYSGGADKKFAMTSGQYRMGVSPWDDPERYRRNSPYQLAPKIDIPMLLIAAERDAATPSWQSVILWHALTGLGKKAELAVYPNEDHVPANWSAEHRLDFLQRVIDFLNQNLKHKLN